MDIVSLLNFLYSLETNAVGKDNFITLAVRDALQQ